ncbi:MAG: hypothetical protein PHW13_05305 [Methylococcales bacterium]|nr:hypothetical protein [Methylococcales bacterium]
MTSNTNEKQALAEIYSALIGTGDSAAADFLDASIDELKAGILEHFKPKHMENLFKDAFIRGVNYTLFQQKQMNRQLTEEDLFGVNGLISKRIDWDDVMLDW